MKKIETERLILREWKEEDINPFYEMGQDSRVMKYFPSLWSMRSVELFIKNMMTQLEEKKYSLWALEEKNSKRFAGLLGLNSPTWEAHFTPCVEIGWRLAFEFWGRGFATEAAKYVLRYAFNELLLEEIVSFTTVDNLRSRKVMERIGMLRDINGDFLHPKLDPNHRLAKHVLYRIDRGMEY